MQRVAKREVSGGERRPHRCGRPISGGALRRLQHGFGGGDRAEVALRVRLSWHLSRP